MKKVVRLKYAGSAPGADSNTYTIFTTVDGSIPRGWAVNADVHSFHWDIKHSQSGTLKGYRSEDGGSNWVQFFDSGALAAPTYTSNGVELVEGFRDFKFEWVNGGSAQATWSVSIDVSVFP